MSPADRIRGLIVALRHQYEVGAAGSHGSIDAAIRAEGLTDLLALIDSNAEPVDGRIVSGELAAVPPEV